MRSDKAIAAALTVALLAGCADRSLDLAPSRADRPWTAATITGGEITAGAMPAAGGGRSYALPANPALGELPAQPSIDAEHAYNLPELLDIAESSNPLSRMAWNEAKQAALSVGLVRSAYLPRLSATAAGIAQTSHDDQRLDAASVAGNGEGSGAIAAVSLQWLLFDFGQRRALTKTAEQLSVIANIHFNATHQKIVRDVSIAFYAASSAREQSADAEHALADALVVQDAVEQRRSHGQTTIVEVAQARQASAQARLGAVQARGHETNLRIALLTAMGISPLVSLKLVETRYRPLVPQDGRDAATAVSQALSRRPDMLAALAARNAADEGIAAARADYRPKVFLSAGASYQTGHLDITALPGAGGDTDRTDNLTGSSRSVHAILGLSFPLYDGGARSAHLAQARARADGAAARFDSVRDLAIQEIVLARTTVETEVAAFQAASDLLTASQTSFDAALGAYRRGVGNLTEVNMAEIALMTARTTRSLAFSDALSAAATLALATGSVSAPERP